MKENEKNLLHYVNENRYKDEEEQPRHAKKHKPGSHDIISISIRAKQKAKQRNQVKPAT